MESMYIFVASLVLLSALYWWRRSLTASASAVLPPGPPSFVPILGHLPKLLKAGDSLHRYLAGLAHTYGPIVFLRLGSTPTILISTPLLAKEFLHTNDKTFADRPVFTSTKFLGASDQQMSLLPYGEAWRCCRKLYSLQLFSAHRIHGFQSTISDEIHRFISHNLLLNRPLGADDPLVNLTDCFRNLLSNILCRLILQKRPSQIMVGASRSLTFAQLMQEGNHLFGTPMIGDFVPWLGFLDFKAKASMKKWKSSYDAIMDHILAERKQISIQDQDDDVKSPKDILDVFLLPENNLSRDAIQDKLLELLSAGTDTSSITLEWAMSELLANPHVLAKLRAELDQVVGLDRWVEHSDIPDLPYLQAVVKETFRKHPPAPLLVPHMSSQAAHVGGYLIPKGTRLIVNAWAIGHDPEVWKDPEVFMPERFLEQVADPVDVKGHHFELLPFGAGKRMCPGMNLAMAIVHLTLATLVHGLEWELPPGQKSIDMSDKMALVCDRVHPLLVLPAKARLHTVKK